MGMLYKECKGCLGIFGQYVEFIKCDNKMEEKP